ncbi:MAG: hypothetical protein M1829_005240 [Trizodia sp. TS-e1964]|nr:MAG: hypothetical protein M1829_005240 [Trizodia sp. TS-e1964]
MAFLAVLPSRAYLGQLSPHCASSGLDNWAAQVDMTYCIPWCRRAAARVYGLQEKAPGTVYGWHMPSAMMILEQPLGYTRLFSTPFRISQAARNVLESVAFLLLKMMPDCTTIVWSC